MTLRPSNRARRGPAPRVAALGLVAALVVGFPQEPGAERGERGVRAPQPRDVRRDDFVLHDDREGGCGQALEALAGSPAGFVAVWRDQRDGNMGLYFARLAPDGRRLGPDRPLHEPRTTRQLDPSVALAADGSGLAAWVFTVGRREEIHVRPFGPDGEPTLRHAAVAPPRASSMERGRGAPALHPSIDVWPEGGGAVAWTEDGAPRLRVLGPAGLRGAGEVQEPAPGRAATGAVRVACGDGGRVLLAWNEGEEVVAAVWADGVAAGPAAVALGDLRDLWAEPAGYGFVVERPGGAFLIGGLDPAGAPRREPERPFAEPLDELDVARGPGGRLALLARAPGASRPRLHVLDSSTGRPGPDREVVPAERNVAPGARVAGDGGGWLVAWTDASSGSLDVWARRVAGAEEALEAGPVQRVNADVASAHQGQPDVDSDGRRALVVWTDRRSGADAVFAREIGVESLGPERRLATGEGATGPSWPVVALTPGGDRSFVAWHEARGRAATLAGRAFGPDGAPLGAVHELEPAADGRDPADVVGLGQGRGWVAAWCSADGIVRARALDGAGAPVGAATDLSEAGGAARRVALTRLGEDRVLAVWDEGAGGRRRLRGRVLDGGAGPAGEPLAFPPSSRGGDWDPVASASAEGFVLVWCSGSEEDRGRDVVARSFDRLGRPSSSILPLSVVLNEQDFPSVAPLADGGWVVAFEDDLSGYDHVYARRVHPGLERAGPAVTLDRREARHCEARTRPLVAPLGDGFLAVWSDRRRSRGWDVFGRVLGPGFDRVE